MRAWKANQIFGKNVNGWGNATTWDTKAAAAGYTVYTGSNHTPEVGELAQWDLADGGVGHVSYVYAVNNGINGIASLDEYNAGLDGNFYSTRTTASSSVGVPDHYIHIGTPASANPPAPTSPVPWNFETLDGGSGSVGQDPGTLGLNPAAVNYNGTLQTFYYDQSHNYLMHAWNDSTGWHFEHLDGAGGTNGRTTDGVGKSPSVVVYNGYLQVFYYDLTANSLRHAWTDASGWHFETLDHSGNVGAASTAAVYGTSLQVFYPNSTNGDLRHTLDGDSASVAGQAGNYLANAGSSLASTIDSGGNLQLFYYGSSNQLLRHTWANSSGWHFENLDGGNLGTISGDHDAIGQIHPSPWTARQ